LCLATCDGELVAAIAGWRSRNVACGPLLLRGFAIGAFLEEVEAERFRAV